MTKKVEIEVVTKTDTTELSSLKEEMEAAKEAGKETGDELSDSFEQVGEGAEEAEESVEELDNSLQNVDGESLNETAENAEELSQSTDTASESANELGDNLDNIDGSGLSDAAAEIDNIATSLDNASGSADGFGDSLSIIESASYMGLADGINQYAAGAENLAQEMNTAAISVGQLATNVGMAEPQMVNLINYISNATFPQEEAMAYVNALNQMGVSANQLGDAATNMDRINDATGIGYQKTMELTQGLRAVGVEANNLPASFNAIAYAQANVNGGAGTLSQVLKTQAATINEYGLNVDQLVLIMQKLSEQGVQGRKMGAELSKVLKDCNGDTTALEQSLGLTAGALSNASQATGQYEGKLQQLANEEAEHKTWIDQLNAAWEDMSLSLSPVLSPLGSFVGLIGQFGQFALAVNSINTLIQGLTGMSIISSIAPMVSSGIGMISAALTFLAANPVILVIAAIVALVAILWYLYNTNEDVRNTIDWLLESLGGLATYIWDSLVGAFQWLCEVITGTGDTIQNSLGGALSWLEGAWNNTVNAIMTYAPMIAEILFIMATGGVGAIGLLIMNMMGVPTKTGSALQSALNKVTSFVSSLVGQLGQGAWNAVQNFANGISNLGQALRDEINEMLNDAANFVGQIGQIMWNAAVNAWNNFLRGLGRHSPGIIQTEMIAELTETGERIPRETRALISNVGDAAKNIVKAWGNPVFDYSFGNDNLNIYATNEKSDNSIQILLNRIVELLNHKERDVNGNTFILNGDMDNEDRMEKFIQAVVRELQWENDKAGRTV